MNTPLKKILLITCLSALAGSLAAIPPQIKADQAMEPADAPKKKQAGEECKTSDECKRHHRCEKSGDKKVCTPLPLRDIPKT